MEKTAAEFYSDVATFFSDDKELSSFLVQLAEHERHHEGVISAAADCLTKYDHTKILPSFDKKFRTKALKPFKKCRKRLEAGTLTKEQLLECIVKVELSEWKKIFLYIVNIIRKSQKDFDLSLIKIQRHKYLIESFLQKNGFSEVEITRLKMSSRVWREKILVVDDEPMIVNLLATILENQGEVHTACNGEDALKKIQSTYYKLIISDQDMPIMDGINFYQNATSQYATIKDRFLFYSGNLSNENLNFFKENRVPYLRKPASLQDIQEHAAQMIHHP